MRDNRIDGGGAQPSARTELVSIETVLGSVDFSRLVAYITLLSRYRIYQTVTSTIYRTVTYSIVSQLITAILRTYYLTFGDMQSQWYSVIPTQILVTVYTVTMAEAQAPAGAGAPTPTPTPARIPEKTPTPQPTPPVPAPIPA
ncbi:MAG: hypothetical protein QXZ31_03825 [Thermofilaceae archaeon]